MICPHCRVSVPSGKWTSKEIISDRDYHYTIHYFDCEECSQISIKFTCNSQLHIPFNGVYASGKSYGGPKFSEEFLMPKTTPREPIPKDVEEIYVRDYNEAVNLLVIPHHLCQ